MIILISLEKYKIKDLELKNRIVMPPMCMYSSDEGGKVKNFHHTHYEARAMGGVGLIILEATGITPNGRITDNDLGIWSNNHIEGLTRLVNRIKKHGSKVGIQLNHAGRKSTSTNDVTLAPSPIAYDETYRLPDQLSKEEIKAIVDQFEYAAARANRAGFDLIEIHGAHGYLIHQFLSPLSNKRTDAYGGSLVNRSRFLKEVLAAVKKVWPGDKPILLRVSASDYTEGGIDIDEMVKIIDMVKPFIDMVHVSSGGLVPAEIEAYPGYQVSFARDIKNQCGIPTIAVGLINDMNHINDILSDGDADLVALGRLLLREPQFLLNNLYKNKIAYDYPVQYERAYRIRR